MRAAPSIAATLPDDRDVYMVFDDFGKHGRGWREMDEERTDRESVFTDLMDGQFSNPVRVVAFNTAEGWSRDVSEDIADELALRLASLDEDAPAGIQDFIDRHRTPAADQLPLPLRGAA
jgi:hypothetical protein